MKTFGRDDFTGCKLAYILDDRLLVYKRDDIESILFPGLLDFPGGGREGKESPEKCVLRELEEEFSIILPVSRLIYKRKVVNHTRDGNAFFFVAFGRELEMQSISFGDEGEYWMLMPIADYMSHSKAIADLIGRLQGYFDYTNSKY